MTLAAKYSFQCFIVGIILFVDAGSALAQGSEDDAVRGLVKPKFKAVLSSEISARISQLPFRDGQRFEKGATLVKFDCSLYLADRESRQAEYDKQRKEHENQKQLLVLNATSNINVDIAESDARKARAEMRMAQVRVRRCEITAPYAGRVLELSVNPHESVAPADKLLSILDDKSLEIELIVPSKWLSWLRVTSKFALHLDETSQTYPAEVAELGAAVDPVSQTVRVIGVFQEQPNDVLAGMSGTARFATQP